MKLNSSKTRLHITALMLGALAVAPLAAQAKVTDHDILRLETSPVLNVDKRSSGDTDSALARRFGADSGVGANGAAAESLKASGDAPAGSADSGDHRGAGHFNRLP